MTDPAPVTIRTVVLPESVYPPVLALVGRSLGKYRVAAEIGRGGMGQVFEAEDEVLKRRVALKVLLRTGTVGEDSLGRFDREAQAAARLHHPHVVSVYDSGRSGDCHWIAMELVRGESAQELLCARGPLPWREATRLIADVCSGLAAAHAAGLIHRDVKPANVLRTPDGRGKLADFGLARFAEWSGARTAAGIVVGTPDFMSPEQCRADPADARSDLYALGATWFALLTGKPPYPGAHPEQVLFAHCSSPIPDPRRLRPEIPEACARIVRRSMEKQARNRYPDARAMRADLEALLDSSPGPGASAMRPSRRIAWIAAGIGGAAVAIAGSVLWFPSPNGTSGTPPAEAANPPAVRTGAAAVPPASARFAAPHTIEPNGRIAVEYDFADPAVAADWQPVGEPFSTDTLWVHDPQRQSMNLVNGDVVWKGRLSGDLTIDVEFSCDRRVGAKNFNVLFDQDAFMSPAFRSHCVGLGVEELPFLEWFLGEDDPQGLDRLRRMKSARLFHIDWSAGPGGRIRPISDSSVVPEPPEGPHRLRIERRGDHVLVQYQGKEILSGRDPDPGSGGVALGFDGGLGRIARIRLSGTLEPDAQPAPADGVK